MINLPQWVEAEQEPGRHTFRQAVHLVLRAIAKSEVLAPAMIMKGGILLAVRYRSTRFTRDIDFSTSQRFQQQAIPSLLTNIEEALAPVSADNEYGLALRLQSHQIKPPNRPDVSFPTLQLRIAYADRQNPGAMRRLISKGAPTLVHVDYSFNEWVTDIEEHQVDGGALRMYAFHDLIAEKLRSVLQQPIRNRERYQDIYDLNLLLNSAEPITSADRAIVLDKLIQASRDRLDTPNRTALRDPQIVQLSQRQYGSALPQMVANSLPPFDIAYGLVQEFYESLPWDGIA